MTIQKLIAARNIDFAPTIHVEYPGEELPLSGASISMQVRPRPGQIGEPLASDASVSFVDEVHPDVTLTGWRRLTIFPEISKALLAAFPLGGDLADPGDKQTFYYEIKITYADDEQESLLIGEFELAGGVNFA